MSVALLAVLLFAGGAAVVAPLLRRPAPWPADPPDQRDDLARAVPRLLVCSPKLARRITFQLFLRYGSNLEMGPHGKRIS